MYIVNVDQILSLLPSKAGAVDGLKRLADSIWDDPYWVDPRHVVYALATAYHETAATWKPITEYGQRSYFDKYEPGTPIGKRLGNTVPGDGYLYRGRGHVQITGRNNYAFFARNYGIDILHHPDMMLQHPISYLVMSEGMRKGHFTGKKLDGYIAGEKCDYVNARRIINGLDKASLIAGYAVKIQGCVTKGDK